MTQLIITTYDEVIMTKADSTPVDGGSTTSLPANRLARLEDQLNHLPAYHEFLTWRFAPSLHPITTKR